ncbi:hypothetical protein [Streptomyces triculaminicus]|uniref:hypothetical protein n=1 Tax=Streptomyces triculaminicus TaxID=2816232 RepID=UPI00378B102F
MSSFKSLWVLACIVALLGVANGVDVGVHGGEGGYSPATVADTLQFSPLASQAPMSAFILFALGVTAVATEYAQRTARTTFLVLSSRRTAYLAKVAVTSVAASAIALGSALLGLVVGCAILGFCGDALPDVLVLVPSLASFALVMLCWPALAAGMTALVGRSVPVIIVLLLWPLVLERLAGLLLRKVPGFGDVADYLPFAAARAALHCLRDENDPDSGFTRALLGSDIHPGVGLVVFCLFAAFVVVAGGLVFARRDAP